MVAQDHKVFPEGKPISQDQGHAEMLSCLRHVEETVVPVTRPSVGGSLSSRNADGGRLPHGLGGGHELPGDAGSIPSPQVLLYFLVATSSPPVMSAGISLDEITYIFQSVRTNRRSQSVRCSVSFPQGTWVTYVTWDVPFQGNSIVPEMLWGTLCVISLEAHVKSIQGVIGTSEWVT